MLALFGVVALAAHYANAARYPVSAVGCTAGSSQMWPTCSYIGVDKLLCPAGSRAASIPLPSCGQVNRQNLLSLQSALCPTNGGTDYLPTCIKISDSAIPNGSINPSQISAGTIPTSTKVTNANIPVGGINPAKLKAGALPSAVTASNANIAGTIPSSKFAAGTLPAGVTVNSNNFPQNSIKPSQLASGTLSSSIKVGNSNFVAGSISPTKLSSGPLPSTIKITSANIAAASLPASSMTCQGSTQTSLSCVGINVENLSCGSTTANLPSCVSIPGESITGSIAAAQVVGNLTRATIEPAQIVCSSTDTNVALPSCLRVDASNPDQLTCGTSSLASVELPCVTIDASQVDGTLTDSASVDASMLRGDLTDDSLDLDGSKILSQTIMAEQLPLFENIDLFSPSKEVQVPLGWQGGGTSMSVDVEVCCPSGIVTSCVNPFMNWQSVAGFLYISFDVDNGVPMEIFVSGSGQSCCKWNKVATDASTGLSDGASQYVPATFTALCMPDPQTV